MATLISYCQERHGAGSKTNQSMEQRAWGDLRTDGVIGGRGDRETIQLRSSECGLRNALACRQAGSAESEKIESQAEIMEKMRG